MTRRCRPNKLQCHEYNSAPPSDWHAGLLCASRLFDDAVVARVLLASVDLLESAPAYLLETAEHGRFCDRLGLICDRIDG
jgi:hypothetical protein